MSVRIVTPGDDGVIRVPGPIRARVTVEAENRTRAANGHEESQFDAVFHYTLDVPAGQVWQLPPHNAGALTTALGANGGIRVVVDSVPEISALVPPVLAGDDLPCGLATSELDEDACCVPRPCDPIPDGAMIAMPAGMPSLVTTPARGGLVEPRYFDGLFLTRADLETQQRRLRNEQRLQNRAHGDGVVWGLIPTFNGRTVDVGVGYGVDCCGNDLLVTSNYRVAADALLADAAGLLQQGHGGLHLLLEYVETPEAPRPVHDECAPGISRTEPSRIRETVRLRLVAPRRFDGRGPIDDLLATGLVESDEVVPQGDVPFDLWVRYPPTILDFPLGTDQRQIVLAGTGPNTQIELETRNKADWRLTAATVVFDDPNTPAPPTQIATLDPTTGTVKWHISGNSAICDVTWQARRSGVHGIYSGTTRLTMFIEIDTQERRLTADATTVTFTPDPPGPCAHEPCEEEALLFPTEAPWIHGFPDAPESAADPRVLDLALSEVGLRGRHIDVDAATHDAVRDLLAAWCKTWLWKGTTCAAAQPHGIVIGCATVRDGRIASVDAWGGRRWVGRPALMNHVATQLGIIPPDLVVSKLALLACCVAKLPVPEPPPPIIIERRANDVPQPVRTRVEHALAERTPPLPPLVRASAERISLSIARNAPVDAVPGMEPPALERLHAVGISTIGDLLGRDPEALVAEAGTDHATSIGRALSGAEELLDAIPKAVGDAIAASGASSRTDLDRDKLVKVLARALKRVPPPIIESAVDEAIG